MTTMTAWISPGWGASLAALAVTLAAFAMLWRLSLRKQDCSVVDLYWGFGFAVIGWIEAALVGQWTAHRVLFLLLVTAWAVRLGVHLVRRHGAAEAEDPRYAAMRSADPAGWPKRSFWMVFMLQAVVMWLVATPVHFALAASPAGEVAQAFVTAGIVVFLAGFALETAADLQIVRFKADPANRGRLLTTGLFAWSRHPNYFGETVLWWGLGLFAFGLSGSLWAFAGPALLTWLLIKVSGIPPLEAHLSERPGFADYAARTSPFIPLPPGRVPAARRMSVDQGRD
jgi:steroid 5-alpha reductase family enzyme